MIEFLIEESIILRAKALNDDGYHFYLEVHIKKNAILKGNTSKYFLTHFAPETIGKQEWSKQIQEYHKDIISVDLSIFDNRKKHYSVIQQILKETFPELKSKSTPFSCTYSYAWHKENY